MNIILSCLILCHDIFYADAAEQTVEESAKQYFEHSTITTFDEQWTKYKKPLENAIELMLKDTFGKRGPNVYVERSPNSEKLSEGFLVCDNIVKVLFTDLYLTEFPYLITPEVSFGLASNVLRVEAGVSKMFVGTDYTLFRNLSKVVVGTGSYKSSPFNLREVEQSGQATIVAEGCTLDGLAIATLVGKSVKLGHETFKLTNCHFSVEISSDTGAPPVIAPYFSQEQGSQLQLLMIKPIREELMMKLQGAMFSYVDTSAMFTDNLPDIIQHQTSLLEKTSGFMTKVVSHLNKLTVEQNDGIVQLVNQAIIWTDKYNEEVQESELTITNVTISGLDSAYSAQIGGPFKLSSVKIGETVRLAGVQIRGSIIFRVGSTVDPYNFYGEVRDVTFHVTKEENTQTKSSEANIGCTVVGWRGLDIHVPVLPLITSKALIAGYLLNDFIVHVEQHLCPLFSNSVLETQNNEKNYENYENNNDNIADEADINISGNKSFKDEQEDLGELGTENQKSPVNSEQADDNPGMFNELMFKGIKNKDENSSQKQMNNNSEEKEVNEADPNTGEKNDTKDEQDDIGEPVTENQESPVNSEQADDNPGMLKEPMFKGIKNSDENGSQKQINNNSEEKKAYETEPDSIVNNNDEKRILNEPMFKDIEKYNTDDNSEKKEKDSNKTMEDDSPEGVVENANPSNERHESADSSLKQNKLRLLNEPMFKGITNLYKLSEKNVEEDSPEGVVDDANPSNERHESADSSLKQKKQRLFNEPMFKGITNRYKLSEKNVEEDSPEGVVEDANPPNERHESSDSSLKQNKQRLFNEPMFKGITNRYKLSEKNVEEDSPEVVVEDDNPPNKRHESPDSSHKQNKKRLFNEPMFKGITNHNKLSEKNVQDSNSKEVEGEADGNNEKHDNSGSQNSKNNYKADNSINEDRQKNNNAEEEKGVQDEYSTRDEEAPKKDNTRMFQELMFKDINNIKRKEFSRDTGKSKSRNGKSAKHMGSRKRNIVRDRSAGRSRYHKIRRNNHYEKRKHVDDNEIYSQ